METLLRLLSGLATSSIRFISTNMQDGVLIIAVGKPVFGRLAYNLAQSIWINDPQVPIALLHDGDSLRDLDQRHKYVFSIMTKLDRKVSHPNGALAPFRLKLMLPQITPFQRTLFLDADSLVFPGKSTSNMIRDLSLSGCSVQTNCSTINQFVRGYVFAWSDLQIARETLGISGDMYLISSSFMFFNRDETAGAFYAKALEIHDRVMNGEIKLGYLNYRGQIPDEPMLAFASGLTNIKMISPYSVGVSGNEPSVRDSDMHAFIKDKYFMTTPGSGSNAYWENYYNNTVRLQSRQRGLTFPFLWSGIKASTNLTKIIT